VPTYTYKCEQCGYQFEEFQKITDAPLNTCPKCNGHIRRLISGGSGVLFKGSSFNKNDYKNKTRCGEDQTCCGREFPCDTPPCEK
jgi:putative FmdB family regulatory protein